MPRKMYKLVFLLSCFVYYVNACDDCSCDKPIVTCRKVCEVCNCADDVIDCSSVKPYKLNASLPNNESYWPMDVAYSSLRLDRNKIGRVVPFPKLLITKLSISFNFLVAIDPKAFYNLTTLEELDLSHNQLTKAALMPEVFEGPYDATQYEPLKIKSLDLSYNEFSGLNPDVFEHLPNLERLILQFNDLGKELEYDTVVAIDSANNLQVLDLSATGLETIPVHFLSNLRNLRELILSSNLIKTVPVDALVYGQTLSILHLDDNPITVISSELPFPVMKNLQQLHISNMPQLIRIEASSLANLANLTYLDCKSNAKLNFIAHNALSTSKLIKLDLHDNALPTIYEDMLPQWKDVDIDIRGNLWVCDCDSQWIVSDLIPLLGKKTEGMICAGPEPMKGMSLQSLHDRNYQMRCIDYYGNHPERDSSFLIATFVIVVLVLVIIGSVWWYKGGRCRKGRPIDYTAIYQQHVREDDKF